VLASERCGNRASLILVNEPAKVMLPVVQLHLSNPPALVPVDTTVPAGATLRGKVLRVLAGCRQPQVRAAVVKRVAVDVVHSHRRAWLQPEHGMMQVMPLATVPADTAQDTLDRAVLPVVSVPPESVQVAVSAIDNREVNDPACLVVERDEADHPRSIHLCPE